MASGRRNLSAKQRRLIKNLPTSPTLTDAALKAGYGDGRNRRIAASNATTAMQNPNVRAAAQAALAKAGLSLDALAGQIKRGLDEAELGPHNSYLYLALKLSGALDDPRETTGLEQGLLASLAALHEERRRRGLAPLDAQADPG